MRQREPLKDNYPKIEYSGAEFFKDTKTILQQIFGDSYFRKMQVFLTWDATINSGVIVVIATCSEGGIWLLKRKLLKMN